MSRQSHAVRWAGAVGALIPLLALVFVLATLIIEALPAIRVNGLHFFTGTAWNPGNLYGETVVTHGVEHPVGDDYGALPLIVGTLATSAIALDHRGAGVYRGSFGDRGTVAETSRLAVGMILELLAGIPSVIVGLWGAMTFGPFIAHHIAPVIARNAPDVPVLNYFRGDTGNGEGMLVSGLVLAVMIIPIIASTTRDLIRQVPALPREGAIALGMSDWECARQGHPAVGFQRHRRRSRPGTWPRAGRDDGRRHGVRCRIGRDAHQHLLDHDHDRRHRGVAAGFGADRLDQLRGEDARRAESGADGDHAC